jgi:glycosyltransferase involved in cell wall biosynthesis
MNNQSPILVSIIVVVYNVEPYLRECLDSLINQTFHEIEIICVYDRSKDSSLSILQKYADNDKRIKIIERPINDGLPTARNVGMSHAEGKYIFFLDSDDYCDTDLCRKVLECAETNQADLVIYDYVVFYSVEDLNANRKKSSTLVSLNPSDRSSLLKIGAFAWTKMIRSDLVHSLNLKFPIGLSYEDMPVHWQLVTRAKKIALLPERLCFYRQHNSSLSYRRDWYIADRVMTYDIVRNFLISQNLYETYQDIFLESELDVFCWLCETINVPDRDRMMALIKGRLKEEHWAYINSSKPLSWRTRDFFREMRGSYSAKARRALWFFARDCYRSMKRLRSYTS